MKKCTAIHMRSGHQFIVQEPYETIDKRYKYDASFRATLVSPSNADITLVTNEIEAISVHYVSETSWPEQPKIK